MMSDSIAGSARMTPIRRCLLPILVTSLLMTRLVVAAGIETSRQTSTLKMDVSTVWVGNQQGGYYPIRIRVENSGEPRELEFELESDRVGFPIVRRTVRAEKNGKLGFVLRVPMVGTGTAARLVVKENSRELDGLEVDLTFPSTSDSGTARPAFLVIADGTEMLDEFRIGLDFLVNKESPAASGLQNNSLVVIPPILLPDSWLDYSGLDLVAIKLELLERIAEIERRALVQWVETGGNLLIYGVDDEPQESVRLTRILNLEQRSSATGQWSSAFVEDRNQLIPMHLNRLNDRIARSSFSSETEQARIDQTELWSAPVAFQMRPLLLGRVVAFQGSPFPGTSLDWFWLMTRLSPERLQWIDRMGMSARQPNPEFLEFLIPGVRSIPVYAFLALITLFTILIGPVNYYLSWKRRQLYLLVLTIPAVAFVTCITMFAYSALAHGFGTSGRIRSLTVLDQRQQTAVIWSRAALHSGLAPSQGLEFDTDTAVYPIWPAESAFDNGAVDWTEKQALRSGWLKSRTRTQLLTISHKSMRGRLNIGEPKGNQLALANGFEWNVRAMILFDQSGKRWFIKDLQAGASGKMQPATDANIARIGLLTNEFPPELPDGMDEKNSRQISGNLFLPRLRRRRRGRRMSTEFSSSLSEQIIARIIDLNKNPPEPGTFVALLDSNPSVELGLQGVREDSSTHLLIGFY